MDHIDLLSGSNFVLRAQMYCVAQIYSVALRAQRGDLYRTFDNNQFSPIFEIVQTT